MTDTPKKKDKLEFLHIFGDETGYSLGKGLNFTWFDKKI